MSESNRDQQDPSRHSYYVDDAFYTELVENFAGFDQRGVVDEASLRDECRNVLYQEARLLDLGRLDEWLSLFSRYCLYWIPGSAGGGDPKREVAISFDDRRRLEDRIYRIRTGYAWSQVPQSRTSRLLSNLEVFATNVDGTYMTRSSFLISELRAGSKNFFSGWYVHRLAKENGSWKIQVKQVNLIDCDQHIRNPSILF